MSYIFTLDGTGYNVGVESISRKARIADGQNSDDALSGYHWRDFTTIKSSFLRME